MELPKFPPFDLSSLSPTECRYVDKMHQAASLVVQTAIATIPIRIPGLDYHTRRHTEEDVTRAFMDIGILSVAEEKITIEDFYLGKIAAATHDIYYEKSLVGTGENEARSTEKAITLMQEHKVFGAKDMERVAELHEATIFKGAGKDGIVQNARKGNFLEELITDIDTGGIGMEWHLAKERIDNFYRELKEKEPDENDPDYVDFLYFQVDVLTGHSYKTQEARNRYSHLDSNAEKIKSLIKRIVG